MKFKTDGDEKYFEKVYYEEVLKDLNPMKVYVDLGQNAVLLCWEKSGDFCHRHIVADWLSKALKIDILEIDSLF